MASEFARLPLWTESGGPDRDIALAARARLARNISGLLFPSRAPEEQLRRAAQILRQAAAARKDDLPPLEAHYLRRLSDEDRANLMAAQRLSPTLVSGDLTERWALLDRVGATSLLLNEEDHLRLQQVIAGSDVRTAAAQAQAIASVLEEEVRFAKTERWGYLTASLGNLGTGLRVSVLVHLPGMAARQRLGDELAVAYDLDTAVRGLHGEGSETWGDLYQISNRISYGRTERELIDRVEGTARHLITEERAARRILGLMHAGFIKTQARARREQLLGAETLTAREALEILSGLRLTAACALSEGPGPTVFARLVASLRESETMVGQRANIARAATLREALRPFLSF
jgi:protein arginine kinase